MAADLRARGLADEYGPGPRLATMLGLLARPQSALDLRRRTIDLLAGVAALRGGRAVLAVRHRDEIALLPVAPGEAAAALLDLLGPVTPAPGRPLHCTGEPSGADAARLADICHGTHTIAQLGATHTIGDGTRTRRAPWVVGVHATPAGHYRSLRAGPRGIVVEPLTRALLATDARRLLAA